MSARHGGPCANSGAPGRVQQSEMISRAAIAFCACALLLVPGLTIIGPNTPIAASDPNAAAAKSPPQPSGELSPPGKPADPLAEVRMLFSDDRFEEALVEVRRVVEADPNSAPARVLFGDALYRRGDFEECEAAYRAGVAIDPNLAAAHFGVGRILRTLGQYGEAGASFQRAAALAPDNAKYIRTLSNHAARRQDVLTLMNRYVELPPAEDERIIKNVRAWIALLKFLGEEPLGEIVRSDPTDLPLNVLKGQAYFKADVNDLAGQRFAFDTGATGITVSPRLAKRAKLQTIHPFEITGMGGKGTVQGDLVLIRSLTVGGISIRNVAATVAEPAGLEEGLMGPSVFGAFRITIDLESGTLGLRLNRPPASGSGPAEGGTSPSKQEGGVSPPAPAAPSGSVRLPFRNVGGQIFVRAMLNGASLNAMVDTGASSSLASLSAVPRVTGLELLPGEWSSGRVGLAGAMRRRALRAATLSFADQEFKADGMGCVDLSRFSKALESEVYLVIGFPELARFVFEIDYRAMALTFMPRAS